MNLNDLKEYIKTDLFNLTGLSVYNKSVSNEINFPYIIYNITSSDSINSYNTTRYLEIELWDDSNNDTDILNYANTIRYGKYVGDTKIVDGLDFYYRSEVEGFYKMYFDWEGEIETGESNITRFHQRYIINDYK